MNTLRSTSVIDIAMDSSRCFAHAFRGRSRHAVAGVQRSGHQAYRTDTRGRRLPVIATSDEVERAEVRWECGTMPHAWEVRWSCRLNRGRADIGMKGLPCDALPFSRWIESVFNLTLRAISVHCTPDSVTWKAVVGLLEAKIGPEVT